MDETMVPSDSPGPDSEPHADALIRRFVEHWGMMARAWGINPTMGELFALLYITGTDWTADELRHRLRVSRGNVSMNLRELMSWGVVRKLHRPGERRELYRAEADVWILFRRILKERKRRELDPTLNVLDQISRLLELDATVPELRSRVESLRQFLGLIDSLAVRLLTFDSREMADLGDFLAAESHDPPTDQEPSRSS
jgi:DNA-binding transcriptional regulator GbsR (MarR family)